MILSLYTHNNHINRDRFSADAPNQPVTRALAVKDNGARKTKTHRTSCRRHRSHRPAHHSRSATIERGDMVR